MKKIIIFFIFYFSLLYLSPDAESHIDWINGKIYSSETGEIKVDQNFAYNLLKTQEEIKEKAKLNFYKLLEKINLDDNQTVLSYFEERSEKNRELSLLIDKAKLYKITYSDYNKITISYFLPLYGNDSLMSLIISERGSFTEELKSYMGYYYQTMYTGVIIDARGELNSFDGYKVKVKPSLFIVIRDSEGKVILNKENVLPEVIKNQGMVKYSYNVNDDFSKIVGKIPLKIVAIGVGDQKGSHIIISIENAKKMLSSNTTKEALKNGKLIIIIDP